MRTRASARRAEVLIADVADAAAVEAAVATTIERFGRCDFAIANAGQSIDSLLLRLKPETIDQIALRSI